MLPPLMMPRPPMSKFSSIMITEAPVSRAAQAQASPDTPAPTTTTSADRCQVMLLAASASFGCSPTAATATPAAPFATLVLRKLLRLTGFGFFKFSLMLLSFIWDDAASGPSHSFVKRTLPRRNENMKKKMYRGFEVYLVNAQYVKNVPGRKTDVSDCQWIQYLHSLGLLRTSFRPPGTICAIRSLWRHRDSLIQMAAEHVMHMQKALDQMNLQVHRVLSDITGFSGLRILDAILAGERDPVKLAQLCHSRVKSSQDTVAKSLEGDYRIEHVFALRQSLAGYRYYQGLIAEVDQEVQRQLADLKTTAAGDSKPPKRTKKTPYQRYRYEPAGFDLRGELYRIFGVDLTDVPGISAVTAHTILCEIGPDVSRFRNASAFASWLGLCPEQQISGGRVLYTKSRRLRHRAALALRHGANSLPHAQHSLGEFVRRITRKLGKAQAITATAHKLARIVFHLLNTKEAYNESVFRRCEEEALKHAELRLRKHAARMGF